jgi:hypothetical protein
MSRILDGIAVDRFLRLRRRQQRVRRGDPKALQRLTMVGMRALDIVRGVELVAGRPDVDSGNIKGIGVGRASVPLLYAAAFDERIKSLELEGMLSSYQSIIDSRIHRYAYEQVLPGVIHHFDLADLVKAIAPRTVSMRGSVDAMGMSEVR